MVCFGNWTGNQKMWAVFRLSKSHCLTSLRQHSLFFYLDILRHFELIDVVFLCSNAGMGEQGDNVRVFFIPSKSLLSLIPSFLKSNPSA